jgi:hypothetical protein
MAEALHSWLPQVLPGEEFFLSSDIEKGTLWFEVIRNQLKRADAAIICLTPDNVDSAWLHFEVGAIAGKRKESRILTYLFAIKPGDVVGPLAAFQSSDSNKIDTRKLVFALGRMCNKEPENFDEHWPVLENALGSIQPVRVPDVVREFGDFLNFKSFREPLEDCSDQSWLDRFARVIQVLEGLRKEQDRVAARCQPADTALYRQVVSDLDNYLRLIKSQLLEEKRFPRVNSKLDFGAAAWVLPEAARICQQIEQKVHALRGDASQPVAPK